MANKIQTLKEIHRNDLMQNCDLPPPLKLYTGPDKIVLKSMNEIYSLISHNQDDDLHISRTSSRSNSEDEKLKILKALRLSQTRARDAERKLTVVNKEKDDVSNLLLQESLRLLAYQQWVKLLELQVSMLQRQHENGKGSEVEDDHNNGAINVTLIIAMSFCLGVGIGYVFHCRHLV